MISSTYIMVIREGEEIEVEVEGEIRGPDYECGIMSHYCESIWCNTTGITLTPEEEERATDKLCKIAGEDDYYG